MRLLLCMLVIGCSSQGSQANPDLAESAPSADLEPPGDLTSLSMLAFDEASYDFATDDVGASIAPITATLINHGNVDSGPLGELAISGDPAFTVVGGSCAAGATLAPGASCTVLIGFAPAAFGGKSATLSTQATPGGSASAALGGVGRQSFTLMVATSGPSGTSTVTSMPAGIDCGSTCTAGFTADTGAQTVTLTANEMGAGFVQWTGDCSGSAHTCDVVMDRARSVTAQFNSLVTVTVTVDGVRGATGTVSSDQSPALSCVGNVCSAQYHVGTNVTLTPSPAPGALFQSWSSGCIDRYAASCATGALSASFDAHVTMRPPVNYMFVSSQGLPGPSVAPDLSGADRLCDQLADAAGLHPSAAPTHFKAWLSTQGLFAPAVNAVDRLGSARGFIRTDGREFADDLVHQPHVIFYPPSVNEKGAVDDQEFAFTGSDGNGKGIAGETCNDWTFPIPVGGPNATLGNPAAGSGLWSMRQFNTGCTTEPWRIYCFETQFSTPVTVTLPPSHRFAFLSSPWDPTGGRGPSPSPSPTADARCAADQGSLPGSYRALISVSGAGGQASARFDATGPVWVRPDGVQIGASNAALFSGVAIAPIDQFSDGSYDGTGSVVWTGSTSPQVAASGQSCGDWSSSSAADSITGNDFEPEMGGWFNDFTVSCTNSLSVYCLQQ